MSIQATRTSGRAFGGTVRNPRLTRTILSGAALTLMTLIGSAVADEESLMTYPQTRQTDTAED